MDGRPITATLSLSISFDIVQFAPIIEFSPIKAPFRITTPPYTNITSFYVAGN